MTGLEIAVIGMAGRFPGAKNVDEFWNNLKNGVESIVFFSDEELDTAGIDSGLIGNPEYVKANGLLTDIEYFDPSFFNYSRREAEVMDPQIRIFHECAWEALENSGYNPEAYKGPIGLYGGASSGFHWEAAMTLSGKSHIFGLGGVQLIRKDMACLRVSYRLNLQGPVFSLYTGCSTSLVAIHLACQGLLSGECDMALAGGVTISLPQVTGYLYLEGMINSRDGHCRAFDAGATGTSKGNGAALVVLKRLEDALADRDYIYALIKGSAINNDGNRKVGFTAPSIKGQAEVIRAAHKMAAVGPESISYIETHGTGTVLGDPIEIKALTRVFNTGMKRSCGIGSVKTNIGHTDAAAGATGFIKATLALKHRLIPPGLHIKTPNPELEIENSPFYVVSELTPWKNNKYPLRAAVSSFGVGGTNAHVILEEAPMAQSAERKAHGAVSSPSREYQLIVLSAKTKSALERASLNLAHHLKKNPGINLADTAYTLQVGRRAFPYRRMLVSSTNGNGIDGAVRTLESLNHPSTTSPDNPVDLQTFFSKEENQVVIFMFPGQGAQYVDMGRDLYQSEPVFREEMDRCFNILKPLMGDDIKEILYPGDSSPDNSPLERGAPEGRGVSKPATCNLHLSPDINQTEITQPILFIFEYALARLLINWGIKPVAMIGHSIGEYTAACLAGVFSLENALKIVALRGKLMQQLPTGAMLSVSLHEKKLTPFLSLNGEVSLAAVNSPSHCVASGPHEAVKHLAAQLKEKGIDRKPLHTSHAFHSKMMEPILKIFGYHLKQIELNKPKIPFISNLTGEIITDEEAVDPGYWVNQLRETVKFSRGINRLFKEENVVFLEVGPGKTLSTFVKQHQYKDKKEGQLVVNLIRHPKESVPDTYYLLSKIGQLWLYGVKIDGQGFYAHRERRRIPLPTYSFDRIRCWPEGNFMKPGKKMRFDQNRLFEINDKADWYYVPSWERSPLTHTKSALADKSCWLVFIENSGFGERLLQRLKKQGKDVITVHTGEEFSEIAGKQYTINPRQNNHYDGLFNRLLQLDKIPAMIIHLWGITPDNPGELEPGSIENTLDTGFNSLIHIAQAIARERIPGQIRIGVVTNNMQEVTGQEILCPTKAAVLAPIKIIPLEYANITCQSIDILVPDPGSRQEDIYVDYLLLELTTGSPGPAAAYRGMHRWTQSFKRVRLDKTGDEKTDLSIKEGSVCLVTGGAGDTAIVTAGYLLNRLKARLILILPPDYPPVQSRDKLRPLEEAGAQVMIANAHASDKPMIEKVIKKAKKRFGQVNILIHLPDYAGNRGKIQEISPDMSSAFVAAKVKSILVPDQVLKDMGMKPDFVLLFSSLGTAVYPSQVGNVSQCAVNDFLDTFSYYKTSRDKTFTSTINNWLTPQEIEVEWLDVLTRILENKLPQVLVSPVDLKNLIHHYDEYEASIRSRKPGENREEPTADPETISLQRQGLNTQYKVPTTETEQVLAGIWQRFFGIEKPGIYDDFLELGGDSLQVMTITNSIHQAVDVKIPIDFFFSNPTIQKLAQYIDNHAQKDIFSPLEPVEKKEYYQLSPMQETILAVHRMNPASVTYNISLDFALNIKIDKETLTRIFGELIKRHKSFRTSFDMVKEVPVQKVHDDVEFEIEYYDLGKVEVKSEDSDEEGTGGLAPLPRPAACSPQPAPALISSFIRPFDLSRAPLLRVGLIKTGEDKFIIMIDMHHIISDGPSGKMIIKELQVLARQGELPRLKIQYKDYAHWYNKELRSGLVKKQEEYWLKQFETGVPVLNLPLDYERPATRSFKGNIINFEIETEKVEKIKVLIREENVTVSMIFLCIYNIFLAKLTGLEDITVFTTLNGRNHNDLTNVVGMFVKTLFYRNYPRKEKGFLEFLKEVRTRILVAYENQDYQPDALADKVAAHRDPRRNPITDVAFALQQIEEKEEDLKTPTPDANPSSVGREDVFIVDLALFVVEKGNRLAFRFAYLTELFKKETIERYAAYFKNILSIVLENRNIKLKDLRMAHEMLDAKSNIGEMEFDL